MSRLFPYPGLSLALAAFWVLLHNSLAPMTLLGAVLIGIVAPWSLVPLEAPKLRIGSAVALFKLAGIVIYDIVRSNFAVAAIILGGARHAHTSGFVAIPLELTNRYGLALLAVIITSTPGTLWAQHDAATNRLLLHVFDFVDEADWIDLVKRRYEPLLREIFQ
ncbi:MAG: Na+/H+ antiporter subunit E [Hyphomonadaceae bacterium]|nr:Na+/H+ antiporter subunit E [Hyphomonadaceae bacterium]GIK50051.1 MAG: cation:proton antiporter [Alphaproteobacteria bacterium]